MSALDASILYAGHFVLFFLLLKGRVGQVRAGEKVMFGDGANERLKRAQRVQGNAVEDVPVTLIGLVGLGLLSAPVWLIHVLGLAFLAGRILHAVGLSSSSGSSAGRMWGTLITLLVMLATAIACIWFAVS